MIPFSWHDFPKPGATDYCAKHQALPLLGRCCSMTSWFHLVDFQCCGKGLRTDNDGKTISILRLYNAICINNIDFRSTTKHLKPRSRVEVSFWTSEVILISIEANPHPCQSFPSRSSTTVAWMTCRCWCGGAKCRSWNIIPVVPGWNRRDDSIDYDCYHLIQRLIVT